MQQSLPAKGDGQEHAWRPDDQDIKGNEKVGRSRSNGGNQHRRRIINERLGRRFRVDRAQKSMFCVGVILNSASEFRISNVYEARAARRVAGAAARGAATAARGAATAARGATLATLALAAVRALAEKQRSSALSTRPSIAAAVSRMTSDTSEMMRNLARSSIRFSRNDRLFDLARKVRLFKTSATS